MPLKPKEVAGYFRDRYARQIVLMLPFPELKDRAHRVARADNLDLASWVSYHFTPKLIALIEKRETELGLTGKPALPWRKARKLRGR